LYIYNSFDIFIRKLSFFLLNIVNLTKAFLLIGFDLVIIYIPAILLSICFCFFYPITRNFFDTFCKVVINSVYKLYFYLFHFVILSYRFPYSPISDKSSKWPSCPSPPQIPSEYHRKAFSGSAVQDTVRFLYPLWPRRMPVHWISAHWIKSAPLLFYDQYSVHGKLQPPQIFLFF